MKMAIPFLFIIAGGLLMYAGIKGVGPIDSLRHLFKTGELPESDSDKKKDKKENE